MIHNGTAPEYIFDVRVNLCYATTHACRRVSHQSRCNEFVRFAETHIVHPKHHQERNNWVSHSR